MKVFFHNDFYPVYTSDPAAEKGRMEAIVSEIEDTVSFAQIDPASIEDIEAVHTERHIERVRLSGLYDIAALSAGGAVLAAEQGLSEPCFALIRPPGHHASTDSAWGFCYFNNMAIAVEHLLSRKKIRSAFVLDIDLHYGDGTVNILGNRDDVTVYNPESHSRKDYLEEVSRELEKCRTDMIGISAGFDNHREDWGNVLITEDFHTIGRMVRDASMRCGGCFGVLEGGYNHEILGQNVRALLDGLSP